MPVPALISFASLDACAERLTDDMAACLGEAVSKRGRASLAVSGGRTPAHIFPILARKDLPWERLTITLADERWVDADHPDSNEGLARRLLLRGPAATARFVGLKTDDENPIDGLARVEAALATVPWPLDAVYLGMGEDGHIASLFPGTAAWAAAPGRVLAVAANGGRQSRISLSPAALRDSRQIYLVITGPDKRAILDAAMAPGPPGEFPVRLILDQDRVPVTVYAAP